MDAKAVWLLGLVISLYKNSTLGFGSSFPTLLLRGCVHRRCVHCGWFILFFAW